METRSSNLSNRSFPTKLGQKGTPLWISSCFTDTESSFKGKYRENSDDTSHVKLASREQNLKISGLESFRESLTAEGISERALKRITNDRRPGTTSNYGSSWHKCVDRCGEQKVDPHTCYVNFVLEFLARLFEQTLSYLTY